MKYSNALKWITPGLIANLANLLTAKQISGLVQQDKYNRAPIIDL